MFEGIKCFEGHEICADVRGHHVRYLKESHDWLRSIEFSMNLGISFCVLQTATSFLQVCGHQVIRFEGIARFAWVGRVVNALNDLFRGTRASEICLDNFKLTFALCNAQVGDLVRKGPDSKGVVELARKLNARTVKGNHDFYAVTEKETKKLNLNPDDVEYLKNAPLSITIDKLNTIIVHAGMLPTGGPQALDPMMLMTMRNVVNNKPSINSDEGVPWVSIYRGPRHVIFGHDAKRGLQLADFATGLDTGCVYGKALTALILPERKFVSVQSSMPIPNRHEE